MSKTEPVTVTRNVVVSVPHSGTRTLVEISGYEANQHRLPGVYWHFGTNDNLLRAHKIHAHIPIRNPLDVAASWASRGKTGNVMAAMLKAYDSMFKYMDRPGTDYTLYHIEMFDKLRGVDESQPEEYSLKVREFRKAIVDHVLADHMEFFKQWY